MARWLLRALVRLVYAVVVVALFVASAYLSFSLFIRRGVTPVPNLVGLELDRASERLADQGLRLRHQRGTDRFSEGVPAGRVLDQRPGPGSIATVISVIASRPVRNSTRCSAIPACCRTISSTAAG